MAYNITEKIRMHCANNHHNKAIGALHGISQLQRTPFASKVVAFIDPINSGIYDNKINESLKSADLLGLMALDVFLVTRSKRDIRNGVVIFKHYLAC